MEHATVNTMQRLTCQIFNRCRHIETWVFPTKPTVSTFRLALDTPESLLGLLNKATVLFCFLQSRGSQRSLKSSYEFFRVLAFFLTLQVGWTGEEEDKEEDQDHQDGLPIW